jgi:hypothetical protein
VALWLSRNLIATRLTKSVQHEFDEKLASFQAEVRKNEEVFKSDLRFKEAEIVNLRGGALTAMASRQIAIDKRRLEAVDQLWSAVISLGSAKGLVTLMSIINFDYVAKMPTTNEVVREKLVPAFDMKKLDLSGSARSRPFVSPLVWALFSAFQAIIMQAVMKIEIIRSGAANEPNKLINREGIAEMVKAALPHRTEYIDKVGDRSYSNLLEEIEEKLLDELRNMMEGVEGDKASIEQAGRILKWSTEAQTIMKKADAEAKVPDELKNT